MTHLHFCDLGAHEWECHGEAVRASTGEPTRCICLACANDLEAGDHSSCPVELIPCAEHMPKLKERERASD
jgi:hypothetical protein